MQRQRGDQGRRIGSRQGEEVLEKRAETIDIREHREAIADRIERRCVDRRQDVERRHRVTEPAECMEVRQRTDEFGLVEPVSEAAARGVDRDARSVFGAYPASACGRTDAPATTTAPRPQGP